MPQLPGVRLPPGIYRLTTTNPATSVLYEVTADAVLTTFGALEWTGPQGQGAYLGGTIGLAFYADGTFQSMNGTQQIAGTWQRVS